MAQTLASYRPNDAFDISTLPRRSRSAENFVDAHDLDLLPELLSVDPSRSRSKYFGAVSNGKASSSCCAVHWAVGWAVTLKWTIRRRSCVRTMKTNRISNQTVCTVKKSMEASWDT